MIVHKIWKCTNNKFSSYIGHQYGFFTNICYITEHCYTSRTNIASDIYTAVVRFLNHPCGCLLVVAYYSLQNKCFTMRNDNYEHMRLQCLLLRSLSLMKKLQYLCNTRVKGLLLYQPSHKPIECICSNTEKSI